MFKYIYIGTEPALLTDYHKDVKPGDVIEVEGPINSSLFDLVKEEKKQQKESDK